MDGEKLNGRMEGRRMTTSGDGCKRNDSCGGEATDLPRSPRSWPRWRTTARYKQGVRTQRGTGSDR